MRILVATSTFPLRPGDGMPRFVEDLCRALAEHGDAVTVLAPDAPGAATRASEPGIEVRRFRYFAPRSTQRLAYGAGMPDNLRSSWLARLQVPAYLAAQARAIRRLTAEHPFDVVNAHWILPTGLATALARGRGDRARFPHVATLHGGDAHLLRRLPGGGRLARFVLDRSDAVVCVSQNVKANLDAALGCDSGAAIQPMGVHVARFAEGGAAPSPFPDGFLVCVARLIRIKGVSVLLRALPRVREAIPGLGLVVIGDGPLRATLEDEARALGLADAVRFLGSRPHDDVAAHLRGCRAAVVPSIVDADEREEGMPAVVAEALAAGARVVASRSGGVVDVIAADRNGWLARPGDPEDLAREVLAALAEPVPSPRDHAARDTARALDWSRVAAAYRAIFRRVAGC